MAFSMTIWGVNGDSLDEITKSRLDDEKRLEDWIARDPSLLGLDILIIGRQVHTAFGGRIDLLAINRDGDLVIIELKRDRTPRDIVAQVLDYASWITSLEVTEIETIAAKYLGRTLAAAFGDCFDSPLPDTLNANHQMIIVASELDDASERIAEYLAEQHGININVIFFNFFVDDGREFLARSWLMDPELVEQRSESGKRTPWSGLWYINVGAEYDRNWEDRRKYGFLSAGGGDWYSRPLRQLKPGDRFVAYVKKHGYVGYGEIVQEACLARDFVPDGRKEHLPQLSLQSKIRDGNEEKPGKEEYAVGVRWLKTFSVDDAKWYKGAFSSRYVVCKLRNAETVAFLNDEFAMKLIGDGK